MLIDSKSQQKAHAVNDMALSVDAVAISQVTAGGRKVKWTADQTLTCVTQGSVVVCW
jgi:hypothetical protein